MALLWWDSFDYLDTSHLTAAYQSVGSGATIVTGGRCSSYCLSTVGTPSSVGVHKGLTTSDTTLILSSAVKRISGSNNGVLYRIYNATSPIVTLFMTNGGAFYGLLNPDAAFPTVSFTTPGGLVSNDQWQYVEIKIKLDHSAGRVQIRVNGSTTDNYDSGTIATVFSGDVVTPTDLEIGGMGFSAGNHIYWDDMVVMDSTGAHCNTFLGDVRVERLRPTSAGGEQMWTLGAGSSHWSAVDDDRTPDDDTTYIKTKVANDIDTNVYQDSSLPTGATVHAVGMKLLAKKDQPANRTIAIVTRQSATDYVSATNLTVNQDSYEYEPDKFEVNPATSSAWTITEVNSAEYGVKVTT